MKTPWMAVIGLLIGTLGLISTISTIGCTNYSSGLPPLVAAPQPCEGVIVDGTCVGYLERVSGFDRVIIERHNAAVEKETRQ